MTDQESPPLRIRLPASVLSGLPVFVNGPMACRCFDKTAWHEDDLRFCWHCHVWCCRECAAAHSGVY